MLVFTREMKESLGNTENVKNKKIVIEPKSLSCYVPVCNSYILQDPPQKKVESTPLYIYIRHVFYF